ncbi:glutathione S-transferase family protein [Vreelandella populi]|uniref:Glutathione S-transferase family protein n=1 Tax=Vreelandella populi TaxID=2498858 RepID=A0A3S0YMJ3_9GAMM|nr:glutathione S-transferase family protein [Halomonas populi]RUR39151.1 glutathione S-transferase family protein [Halomonas populi]RUR46266.1 glutathione S-transferase family protein [Halomonas populi]
MPDLYIANKNYSSWSLRPWVLMQTLDIPFNEQLVPFRGGLGASREAFTRFSPSGLVPCLVDGDIAVWDSLAIIEYVAEQHPQVWPKDKVARAWARSACAEMHSGFTTLRDECSMNCGVRVALDRVSAGLSSDIERLDARWQEGVARFSGPFLAGNEFTAVDAFYAPVVFRVQTFGLPLSEVSRAYVKRMLALPAMQAWYQAALEETWREPAHEADTLQHGTLTADYRNA